MKTLVLMRHGKAVDTANSGKDFDRALSAKGHEQVKVMSAWLKEQGILPDSIISSSALRTQETARGMATSLGMATNTMDWRKELYLASPSVYASCLLATPNEVNTLMVVGHNTGISEWARELLFGFYEELPTAGVLVLQSETPDWASWLLYKTQFVTYQIPKRLMP
jgi:phosphohistidine phosphatase